MTVGVEDGEQHTIRVSGRLDRADRAALVAAGRALLDARRSGTVDVSGLEAWDLATFQILLALRRDVAALGENVRLIGLRPDAASVQDRLGLTDAMSRCLAWEIW